MPTSAVAAPLKNPFQDGDRVRVKPEWIQRKRIELGPTDAGRSSVPGTVEGPARKHYLVRIRFDSGHVAEWHHTLLEPAPPPCGLHRVAGCEACDPQPPVGPSTVRRS